MVKLEELRNLGSIVQNNGECERCEEVGEVSAMIWDSWGITKNGSKGLQGGRETSHVVMCSLETVAQTIMQEVELDVAEVLDFSLRVMRMDRIDNQ